MKEESKVIDADDYELSTAPNSATKAISSQVHSLGHSNEAPQKMQLLEDSNKVIIDTTDSHDHDPKAISDNEKSECLLAEVDKEKLDLEQDEEL